MKNIKALLGSLAIAAILGANGYMAMSGTKAQSELTLEGVERVAQGWEWSDFLPGDDWWKYTKVIDCNDYDYPWYYTSGSITLNFRGTPVTISLNAKKGGTKTVTQCGSGSGDCFISQSDDCVNW